MWLKCRPLASPSLAANTLVLTQVLESETTVLIGNEKMLKSGSHLPKKNALFATMKAL